MLPLILMTVITERVHNPVTKIRGWFWLIFCFQVFRIYHSTRWWENHSFRASTRVRKQQESFEALRNPARKRFHQPKHHQQSSKPNN